MTISLNQQIEEVERELQYRAEVYPRLYAKGTLRTSHGQFHIQRMQAVLDTLRWIQKHEALIREAIAAAKVGAEAEADDDN